MDLHDLPFWHAQASAIAADAAGGDGAHDLNHQHRVWRNARLLLDAYPQANVLVVMIACYLHDLVNLPKNDPQRHLASRASARAATDKLAALGFPDDLLDAVAHAIEAHSFSAALPANTIEAKIVQDADRLDALGAIGLARLFYTAGRMGIALADSDDPLAVARAPNERLFALDHIVQKLATLPAAMQTEHGRALANERMAALTAFRQQFGEEWCTPGAPPRTPQC